MSKAKVSGDVIKFLPRRLRGIFTRLLDGLRGYSADDLWLLRIALLLVYVESKVGGDEFKNLSRKVERIAEGR